MMLLRLLNRKPRLKVRANDPKSTGLPDCGRTGGDGVHRHPDRTGEVLMEMMRKRTKIL